MSPQFPPRSYALIATWGRTWQLPDLADALTLEVSTRLRTSLGRCRPDRGHIRIAAFVLDAHSELLDEVLCHETAHAAVWRLHGPRTRPHGPEWRQLMRAAGFVPRTRVPARLFDSLSERALKQRTLFEHRCPVCGVMRDAGRPVPQWRCRTCRAAGRSGELSISRRAGMEASSR